MGSEAWPGRKETLPCTWRYAWSERNPGLAAIPLRLGLSRARISTVGPVWWISPCIAYFKCISAKHGWYSHKIVISPAFLSRMYILVCLIPSARSLLCVRVQWARSETCLWTSARTGYFRKFPKHIEWDTWKCARACQSSQNCHWWLMFDIKTPWPCRWCISTMKKSINSGFVVFPPTWRWGTLNQIWALGIRLVVSSVIWSFVHHSAEDLFLASRQAWSHQRLCTQIQDDDAKAEWDALPQEKKDEYGYEYELFRYCSTKHRVYKTQTKLLCVALLV